MLVLAGPADGPQAKGLLPYDIRKQLVHAQVRRRSTPTRTASSTASS